MNEKQYLCIDLKSFYASVECIERGFDPMTTNLVVADESRTEKTICLAVSPSLKKYGIPGRARLFEAVQKVKEANTQRKMCAPNRRFIGSSYNATELNEHPELAIDYITAPPRMAHYMEYSTRIYQVYLKYDEIINKKLLIRRINISANRLIPESEASENTAPEQLDIFTDYEEVERQKKAAEAEFEREKRLQNTIISLKKKFGKNTILKGMNFAEGATAKDRNQQIGGHKA